MYSVVYKLYPAYVQQLAWNVLAMSGDEITEENFHDGLEATLAQVSPLFVGQEIVEITESGCYLADPLFEFWFKREMM